MGRIMETGLDQLMSELDDLAKALPGVAGYALFDGAGVMADAVKAAALTLPYKGSTVSQIADSVGIHKFNDTEDGRSTSIGFDGYFANTKYKDGAMPIQMFVREVEGGTSKIPAHPFVRKTANAAKASAEAAILAAAEEKINAITGGK